MEPNRDADAITLQLRSEEATLRRRIVWLTLIPVVIAAVLIWVTGRQVASIQREIALATDSLTTIHDALQTAEAERLRKHAEIDSLETLARTFYDELLKINEERAAVVQSQAIDSVQVRMRANRVYLHIVLERQRAGARRLQAALEKAGFVVPGIELVAKGPDRSQLRYFRSEDGTGVKEILLAAEQLAVRLEVNDLSRAYAQNEAIPTGTFEIWLGRDFDIR